MIRFYARANLTRLPHAPPVLTTYGNRWYKRFTPKRRGKLRGYNVVWRWIMTMLVKGEPENRQHVAEISEYPQYDTSNTPNTKEKDLDDLVRAESLIFSRKL